MYRLGAKRSEIERIAENSLLNTVFTVWNSLQLMACTHWRQCVAVTGEQNCRRAPSTECRRRPGPVSPALGMLEVFGRTGPPI